MLLYTVLSDQKLFVADTCPLLIKAIPTRIHDEKDTMSYLKTPGPEDDAIDDCRYGLYSHSQSPDESRELKIARRIGKFESRWDDEQQKWIQVRVAEQDDPTIAHMQRLVAEKHIDEENESNEVSYTDWTYRDS